MLSTQNKQQLQQQFEDQASAVWDALGVSRQDIAAAVTAIDQWVDNNTASFNQAIPEPARSNLTAVQKAKLLYVVTKRRMEVT
jgi:hypothetical protein